MTGLRSRLDAVFANVPRLTYLENGGSRSGGVVESAPSGGVCPSRPPWATWDSCSDSSRRAHAVCHRAGLVRCPEDREHRLCMGVLRVGIGLVFVIVERLRPIRGP